MKKMISFILAMIIAFTLAGCANSNPPQNSGTPVPAPASTPEAETPKGSVPPSDGGESINSNILVVYFSMPETTAPNNMTKDEENSSVVINGEVLGNTQYIAYLIQENTGGDIFRIEPETPYPTDHTALLDVAYKEKAENARPKLENNVENTGLYDVVFVGFPNWNADMPMILYSFLESVDLSGKTIIPFNTHGGSGFSRTISTIADLQPNAEVITDGYSVSRDKVDSAEGDVIAWLRKLGY